MAIKFSKHFLWGASTSAHQVEGNTHNNWSVWELENAKALAKAAQYKIGHLPIWPEIKKQASTPSNYVSGRAIDHYNRYESDFDIVRKMNLNAFRFSIEWSRVEPEEGVWDIKAIEHYKKYLAALHKRGIEPVATLFHWTMPVWLAEKGGFVKASNIQYFVRFADKILEELGHDLRYITTINEPDTLAGMGYFTQEHPPGKRSPLQMLWVYRNQLRAHKLLYGLARKRSRRFKLGFTKAYSHRVLKTDKWSSKLSRWFVTLALDTLTLRYVGRKQDFIGVNYYHTDIYDGLKQLWAINYDDHKGEASNDLGWSLHPEDLEHVLKRLGRFKKPLIVMETGVADMHDQYRKQWLQGTILAIGRAMEAGVDVRGYLHWSMFDNFEWAFGSWPRFGLVGIDYEDDLRRVPRKSAVYYAQVVKKARGL